MFIDHQCRECGRNYTIAWPGMRPDYESSTHCPDCGTRYRLIAEDGNVRIEPYRVIGRKPVRPTNVPLQDLQSKRKPRSFKRKVETK